MDFRSLVLLAIWTLISGPIFTLPSSPASSEKPATHAAAKATKAQKTRR